MASTIRELCREEYQRFVREADIDPELKRALKTHERVPALIDNLASDLGKVGPNVKKENIVSAVRDVSRWFVQSVVIKAREAAMSDAQKSLMKREQEKAEQFQKDVETYDEKGAMHVIQKSESFEEERSKIGLREKDYEVPEIDTPPRELSTPRASDKI